MVPESDRKLDEACFDLGAAISEVIGRLWLRGRDAQALDDRLAERFDDLRDRRRARRALDRIADQLAELVHGAVSAVKDTHDVGEIESAVHAASAAIRDASGLEELADQGSVDAFGVEARFAGVASEDSLAGSLLRDAADYVAAFAAALPGVHHESTRALLRREADLLALLDDVASELPASSVSGGPVGDFETRYRRDLVRRLNRLELFGLSVSEASRRYQLTTAYISLRVLGGSATTTDQPRSDGPKSSAREPAIAAGEIPDQTSQTETEAEQDVSVESAVGSSPRLMLRGEAGSGKTTLLQWLASTSAAQGFDDDLSELNLLVPFLVQLRHFATTDLPRPEELLTGLGEALVAAQPDDFCESVLAAGRGLVLVDGIDELPLERREDVRDWLSGLCARFPDCRFVVTTRPPAVVENWLEAEDFDVAELLPMGLADIDEFVRRWHRAAIAAVDDASDRQELTRLEARLLATIRATRPIRSLATSPLLCAMLCALNRERHAQLPAERRELYRIALETLLERRDFEREMPVGSVVLSLAEKQAVLRALALELVDKDSAETDWETAAGVVRARVREMPNVASDGAEVLRYLLERSGLLREPSEGRIDFIHRTFQEYLAAGELVMRNDIDRLVEKASSDSWREVVILASGQAQPHQREDLLQRLLQRADEETEHLSLLRLLAVACLEGATLLSPEVQRQILQALRDLVPPVTMTAARDLATAGELAVDQLGKFAGGSSDRATACVRTLCLVGGEGALVELEKFAAGEGRVTVVRELLRGWPEFDADEYALRVLQRATFDRPLEVRSRSGFGAVRHLRQVEDLRLVGSGGSYEESRDLGFIARLHDLSKLELKNLGIEQLSPLAALRGLSSLSISACPNLTSVAALAELPELSDLTLRKCPRLEHLATLHQLPKLTELRLETSLPFEVVAGVLPAGLRTLAFDAPVESLMQLPYLPELRSLEISNAQIVSLDGLSDRFPQLLELRLVKAHQLASIDPGSAHGALTKLVVHEAPLPSLHGLESLPALKIAQVYNSDVADVSSVRAAPSLENLRLLNTLVRDISGLAGSRISYLDLERNPVSDLSPIAQMSALFTVDLTQCLEIETVAPLGQAPRLQHINISRCVNIKDANTLVTSSALRRLVRANGPTIDRDQFRAAGISIGVIPPGRRRYRRTALAARI